MANKWQLDDIPQNVNVRAGRIAGAQLKKVIGHSDAVGTNLRVLHHETNNAELDVDGLLQTPAQIKISSTSTNDDVGQSGATSVRVDGLDDTGAVVQEVVALDGQNEVTTTNTFKVVEKLVVLAAGATGSNEGILYAGSGTVTTGVPATKYMSMKIGTNVSTACVAAVPTDKMFVLTQIFSALGDTTKTLNFQFKHYVAATGLWLEIFDLHVKAPEFILPVEAYAPLSAGDVLIANAKVDASTATATVAVAGYLLDA